MNKADEFPAFPELLFRWETDRKGKQTHKIITSYAECVEGNHQGWRDLGGRGRGSLWEEECQGAGLEGVASGGKGFTKPMQDFKQGSDI